MLKNYFLVAYRNLIRHKGFSFLNIAGLALGLTACLLIGLFVHDELQFDKFVPHGEQIYRVYTQHTKSEASEIHSSVSPMFATTLKQEFPEVEQTTRILMTGTSLSLLEVGEKKIYVENGLITDSTFFNIFELPFKYGSAAHALDAPEAVVLAEDVANNFFGNVNPVGKELKINKSSFQVTGVLRGGLSKFHLKANYLIPMAAAELPAQRMKNWGWQQFYTYVKLRPGTNAKETEAKLQDYLMQKVQPTLSEDDKITFKTYLQPLHTVHLYSAGFKYDSAVTGNITYVKALGFIAVFILLIAGFNFVNLATAKSMQRAKEVGIRKTIGASKQQLMLQFLSETLLLTLVSVVLATVLTALLLPSLNSFTGKSMEFNLLTNPALLALLVVLTVVVGLLAGFYPALVLSSFQPVKVLKSAVVTDGIFGRVQWLRHGLIVVQFALSVFLIVCALVVFKQVSYLHNKDLGFNRDQIMFFPMRGDNMNKQYEAFKNELQQVPGVVSASIGYGFPGDQVAGDGIIVPGSGERKEHSVTQLMVDYDYLRTLGLQLVTGRDFTKEQSTDKDHAFIINETAVKELGLGTPQQALGRKLEWKVWNDKNPDSLKVGQVIGVVKDFHYKSLYDRLEPAVLQIFPDAYWKVAVKMKGNSIGSSVDGVKQVWGKFSPESPIEYRFLDQNFDDMYKAEDKLKTLLWIFTGVAIFVGCLGLFGLATYAAERRKKEIGIRKVLGASVGNIVSLLSKEFLVLVLVAALIAFPAAWLAMSRWLQDFAYRIDLPLWAFVAAGLLAAAVAFLTVGYQALRAATANPVNNLRSN
ncbi:FtsX-like permease family protein [Hymenobacter taeanensis]|uniref:FtsX-like permease family protein n=1 Tax=Hymenobacter taeanensis TaxID=2735321 RepID=A0A6M6BGC1_9BACT|nr:MULTISPECIES: ABC transporter permease [Hymenobacter]QJX47032.1 FtsX-like permease family protein [Hymenobacter taeanensis]UOQ80910.1 ABC transporter permease [Hymenobacter sp. 5414T-23]